MKNILFIFLLFAFIANGYSQDDPVTRALVVGVKTYKDEFIPPLQYSDKDAEAFREFLMSRAGGKVPEENIRFLVNEDASVAQIYRGLDWLIQESKEGDRAIVYFAGHGDTENVTIMQRGHLLGYDSPSESYYIGTVRVTDIEDRIKTLSARNQTEVIVILDACKSGKLAGGAPGVQATARSLSQKFGSEIKLMSCQPDEKSLEDKRWGGGRGVFSYYLIEGLYGMANQDGDFQINVFEIDNYLRQHIPKETGFNQMPLVVQDDPRFRLSFVDEDLLEKRKQGMEAPSDTTGVNLASRGSSMPVLAELDTNIRRMYKQFEKAIADKHLLKGEGPQGKCAEDLLERLPNNDKAKGVRRYMKRTLVAALQDDAQKVLNLYLKADSKELLDRWNFTNKYDKYPGYFKKAKELLGKDHYRYEYLESIELYFNALLLRLEGEKQYGNDSLFNLALDQINMAIEKDDKGAYLHNEKGWILYNLKRYEESEQALKKATEIAPTWVMPYNNLCILYANTKKFEDSERMGKKVIELDSSFVNGYANLGYNYFMWFKDDLAEKAFFDALTLDPENTDALTNLGWLYLEQGDLIKAKKYSELAIKSKEGNVEALNNLGRIYSKEKNESEAKKYFTLTIERNPEHSDALNNLGFLYKKQGDLEKGKVYLKKAVKTDSKNTSALNNLGHLFLLQEDYDQAEVYLKKAIQINPKKWLAHYNLGDLYLEIKNYAKAEEQYLAVLEYNPSYQFAFISLALVKAINKEEVVALNYLKQALEKGYSNREWLMEETAFKKLRKQKAFKELMQEYFPEQ